MPEVTYGRLDEVLRSLGFSARVTGEKTRVYRHGATGALVALPDVPPGEVVTPHQMVAVRATLQAYGTSDHLDFALKLQRAS